MHGRASGPRCSTTSPGRSKAKPEHAHGVAFFNSFRDLTASGFFTSKMGIADLQYMGNRYVRGVDRVPAGGAEEARASA